MSPEQCGMLAKEWYSDCLSPSFRRKTADEAQAVFDRIGLRGPFWQLS